MTVTIRIAFGEEGVRRVGTTTAAGGLQRGQPIEYHRGEFAVLDPRAPGAGSMRLYDENTQILDRLSE